MATRPVLSVAMPTRDRAALIENALQSVVCAPAPVARDIEIAISDGSADDATGRVVDRVLAGWPGTSRYSWDRRGVELVPNINRALALTTGEWSVQLHDDDYWLPGAAEAMMGTLRHQPAREKVLMFGVDIVDGPGNLIRRQAFSRSEYLPPDVALRRLLSNSSFIHLPAIVVHRSAFDEVGTYDPQSGGTTDLDMCVRLFARYGVRCVDTVTCAYRIHGAAFSTGMWNPVTIRTISEIFDRAVEKDVVPERRVRRWETDFYHQFILAGVYRQLRAGHRSDARNVLRLFRLPEVRALGLSPKWTPVRAAFTALSAVPG